MKWIGNRISFVDSKNITTIIITPEQIGWKLALMGAWFFMWLCIGIITTWAYFYYPLGENQAQIDQQKLIIVIFLVFWVYYAVRVGRQFFWLLYGKESIKINENQLIIKNSILNYGKAQYYFIENIEDLEMNVPDERSIQQFWESSPWIRGGERISFKHQHKVGKFARKIKDKDAQLLFQFIAKKIDDKKRILSKN